MKLRNIIKIMGLVCFFLAAPVGADIKLVAKVDQTAAGFPSHFSYKDLKEPIIGPSGYDLVYRNRTLQLRESSLTRGGNRNEKAIYKCKNSQGCLQRG